MDFLARQGCIFKKVPNSLLLITPMAIRNSSHSFKISETLPDYLIWYLIKDFKKQVDLWKLIFDLRQEFGNSVSFKKACNSPFCKRGNLHAKKLNFLINSNVRNTLIVLYFHWKKICSIVRALKKYFFLFPFFLFECCDSFVSKK